MGKSPCCGVRSWRFGERRRRCSACRKTWRIRARKRGRPSLRLDDRLIRNVLLEHRSLTELAKRSRLTRQALSYRFLRALEARLLRSKAEYRANGNDLVLLIDGLWFRFKRRPWVLYLMAFKPSQDDRAVFIDPVLQQGMESREGWHRALNTIPSASRARIRAVVSDNFAGCTTLAEWNGWILQLCHFHLLASLRTRLGAFHRNTVGARALRQEGYQLVRTALTTNNSDCLSSATIRLRELADDPGMPWKFGNILREFVRRLPNYRAYQLHPHLRLPRTTGSVESMGRVIRDVMRRTRNVTTPAALNLWVTNYLRLRPEIICKAGVQYTK